MLDCYARFSKIIIYQFLSLGGNALQCTVLFNKSAAMIADLLISLCDSCLEYLTNNNQSCQAIKLFQIRPTKHSTILVPDSL